MTQSNTTIIQKTIEGTHYTAYLKYDVKTGQLVSVVLDGAEGYVRIRRNEIEKVCDFLQNLPLTLEKE
jgi:hypothetical protein